jgi:hypothetical protein
MKKTVFLIFKNGKTLPVELKKMEVTTNQAMLPTKPIELPLFIEVNHQGLTTLLNLSHQSDCMVLQFKKDGRFSGATICKNRNEGAFMIQSQATFILMMPWPLNFSTNELEHLSVENLNNLS